MSRFYGYIIILVIVPFLVGFNAPEDSRQNQLYNECLTALYSRRYDDMAERGKALSMSANDDEESLRSLGKAFVLRGEVCGSSVADRSMQAAEAERLLDNLRHHGDTTSVTAYFLNSALCLYHIYDNLNYGVAGLYAYRALKCAERMGNTDLETDALSLLSALYFLKQDSLGWEYAVRCENLAKSTSNFSGIYTTALNMANYLYNNGDYEKALTYLLKGKEVMERGHLDAEKAYVNSFLGDVWSKLGRYQEAEQYYRQAVCHSPESSSYDIGYAKMRYADFLTSRQRVKEALSQLHEVEASADSISRPNYYSHLLLQSAQTHEANGDKVEALDYYKRYMTVNTELINAEKEKEISALETRYKVVEAQNRNIRQSLELSEKNRRLIVLSCVSVALLIIAILLWILNRRTKRYYRRMVADTLERLSHQEEMEAKLKDALLARGCSKNGSEGEKGDKLFETLRRLMEEEHVYRQPDLSIETLAHMMGTNRTYLSRIINERAGMSYANYINNYRLNEIIKVLSDPSNKESLKQIGVSAGFATMANFYNLFKQRVGVSPAVFRKNVEERRNG